MQHHTNTTGPKIRATEIKASHATAIDEGRATPEQADLVYWLYSYACDNNLPNGVVAKKIGYDPSNIARIYKLTYTGKIQNVAEAIEQVKRDSALEDERQKYGDAGFVETTVSEAVFDVCDATRINQEIAQIWGESQTGKTEALKRYADLNNHGRTRYIELESGMSHHGFLRYLAERCNAPVSGDVNVLRQAIKGALTENNLVIFDEVHKPLLAAGPKTKIKIMDSIRDLNDKIGCGIVLCGTNTLRDEFTIGSIRDVLKQMDKRGVIKVKMPDILPDRDVWQFVEAHGLKRPAKGSIERKLILGINETNGIGQVIKFLRAGHALASEDAVKYGWPQFIEAHDEIVSRNTAGWWND